MASSFSPLFFTKLPSISSCFSFSPAAVLHDDDEASSSSSSSASDSSRDVYRLPSDSSSPSSEGGGDLSVRPTEFVASVAILSSSHGGEEEEAEKTITRTTVLACADTGQRGKRLFLKRRGTRPDSKAMAEQASKQQIKSRDRASTAVKKKRHLEPNLTMSLEAEADTDMAMAMPFPVTANLDLLQKKRMKQQEPWELGLAAAMAENVAEDSACSTPAAVPFSWEQEPGKPLELGDYLPPRPLSKLPLPPRLLLPPPPASASASALPSSPASSHRKNLHSWHNLLPLAHHRRTSDATTAAAAAETMPVEDGESTGAQELSLGNHGDARSTRLFKTSTRFNPLMKLFNRGKARQAQNEEKEQERSSASCLAISLFRRNDRVSGERSPYCVSPEADVEESTGFLPEDHLAEEQEATEEACPDQDCEVKATRRTKKKKMWRKQPWMQRQEDGGGGVGYGGFLLRKGSRVVVAACEEMKRRVRGASPWRRRRRRLEYESLAV